MRRERQAHGYEGARHVICGANGLWDAVAVFFRRGSPGCALTNHSARQRAASRSHAFQGPGLPAAGELGRCADASARRACQRAPWSFSSGVVTPPTRGAPRQPPRGPAALGSRRIGAAALGRRVLGPTPLRCAPGLRPAPRGGVQLSRRPVGRTAEDRHDECVW